MVMFAWPCNPSGEGDMWLEPQGFTLLIPEVDRPRKGRLWSEIQQRLVAGEAMGARQIVATFDREAAGELLKKMTFANYAHRFPEYWTGQWAASDSLDSSLLPSEGLSGNWVYCAHAHAWPLYCYVRLKERAKMVPRE